MLQNLDCQKCINVRRDAKDFETSGVGTLKQCAKNKVKREKSLLLTPVPLVENYICIRIVLTKRNDVSSVEKKGHKNPVGSFMSKNDKI